LHIFGFSFFERSTHNNYTLDLVGLFRVERKSERENYARNLGNDFLGWHGCPQSAVASILKTGLRIAPNGVANGKAYGQGLYFAECSSKSANYTKASSRDNLKVLFLCKVALGSEKVLYRNDEQLPSTLGLLSSLIMIYVILGNHNSVKALGKLIPSTTMNHAGCNVPCGKLIANPDQNVKFEL